MNKQLFLSKPDEYALITNVQERKCKSSLTKLCNSHENYIKKIVSRYKGYFVDFDDLCQEAYIGLIKAVSAFDTSKGFRLNTFAYFYIKCALSDYVIGNYKISKIVTNKEQRKLFFNLRSLLKVQGVLTYAEAQSIAKKLNISKVETVLEMHSKLCSSDSYITQTHNEDTFSIEEGQLGDATSDFAAVYLDNDASEYQRDLFERAMSSLTNQQAFVIMQRWMNEVKMTFRELAELMNVSIERVRQIEVAALNTLKVAVTNH